MRPRRSSARGPWQILRSQLKPVRGRRHRGDRAHPARARAVARADPADAVLVPVGDPRDDRRRARRLRRAARRRPGAGLRRVFHCLLYVA